MKENAILIRQLDVLKIHVDFSDINNIYEAVNADRVSTIHTAKTQELSSKLGVHLVGYVDREGNDINNPLACKISGYDYLGSFMLLCKTDDKWNNYGFTPDELDRVYTYLTTGKIVNKVKVSEIEKFFEEYHLDPPLPRFDLNPKVYYQNEVPYVMLLRYDLKTLPEKKMGEIGKALFDFSSALQEECQLDDKGVNISKDERYCLKSRMSEDGFYDVLIQAMDGEEIIITNIDTMVKAYLGQLEEKPQKHEDVETTMEEAYDEDWDEEDEEDISDYVIEVYLKASYEDTTAVEGKYVYPLVETILEDAADGYLPILGRIIHAKAFSLAEQTVTVVLEDKEVKLALDESQHVELEFYDTKAELELCLRKHFFGEDAGRIVVVEETIADMKKGKIVDSESHEFEARFDSEDIAEVVLGLYQVLLVDEEGYVIMNGLVEDESKEDHVYIPVSIDEPTINTFDYVNSKGKRMRVTTKMYFKDENILDDLPEIKDPLDDVKERKIDDTLEMFDPLDDVK